nr:MAG TPA: hypothetical protein [Caudoviricetes sp.]
MIVDVGNFRFYQELVQLSQREERECGLCFHF